MEPTDPRRDVRNLIAKFGFTPDDTAELELRLTEYLPRALIEVRRRDSKLVAEVEMDAKDRHVVAATLSAKATILVTDNARHFPTDWLAERKIELLTPAELLARLAADQADAMKTAHRLTVANSPKTEDAILATLRSQIGDSAADAVRRVVVR